MGGSRGKSLKVRGLFCKKVVSVVKLQKYVKLPLGIYVKIFLTIGLT
jgi:hypothetical protein